MKKRLISSGVGLNHKKLNILMLGVKEYPYGVSAKYEKYPGGGTAKYVIALSEGLAKKGHEVHMIVRHFPGQKRFEVANGVHIHRVGWINNKYLRLPSFNFMSYFAARKIIKDIDLIHCHGNIAPFFVRLFLRGNQKVICTPHGLASLQVKYAFNPFIVWLQKTVENIGFKGANLIIFDSPEEQRNFFMHHKLIQKRSEVVLPGIRSLTVAKHLPKEKFRMLFVGRLVDVKGIDKLITSVSFLKKSTKEKIELLILGEGYSKQKFIELTHKLNIHREVLFLGYKNNVADYLDSADIMILPSEGGEGFPTSIIEAMSLGVACIVTNFGLPVSEKSVFSIKNNKPETIALAIEYLFTHPKKVSEIKTNALEEYGVKFSDTKTVEEHLKIYKNESSTHI